MENRIGAAIKEKRKEHGYTQEQLAEKVGITPGFIGQIERGDSFPSLETLTCITQLLAIDANVYFRDVTDREQEIREFYFMLEQMRPEMRELTFKIIRDVYRVGKN